MSWIKATWTRLLNLIRGTDSDLEGTYPDHYKTSGTEAATHGSVNAGFLNGGGTMH